MSTATLMSTQNADAVAITGGTMSGVTTTGGITTSIARATSSLTKNASATYADIPGLTLPVSVGTYRFIAALPSTVASGTGGIKYAFNYTTAVLSTLGCSGVGYTASAVAVQNSATATAQADLFTQAAVVIDVLLTGTIIVTTAGSVQVQMAQNTSDASNTVALVGGWFQLTRIA